jgi:hypothetical protein
VATERRVERVSGTIMSLWLLVLGLPVLILAIGFFVLSIDRAERRARRGLYRNLGLEDVTVEFLMERNRGVLKEITFVRGYGEAAIREAQATAAERSRNVKLLRPRLQVVAPDPSTTPTDPPPPDAPPAEDDGA